MSLSTLRVSVRARKNLIVAATAAASAALASQAMAQTPPATQPSSWTRPAGDTGSFNDGNNWSTAPAAPSIANVTDAEIGNGGTAQVTASDATASESGYLILGRRPGESGTLNVTGGTLNLGELRVGGKEYIYNDTTGVRDPNGGGTGVVVQTGGTVNVNQTGASTATSGPNQSVYIGDAGLTDANTANGSYTISGGALHAGVAQTDSLVIATGKGTVGSVTESGASTVVDSTGFITIGRVGGHGSFTLNGGSLTAVSELNIGDGIGINSADAQGTFTQTAGDVLVKGNAPVTPAISPIVVIGRRGGTGSYDMSGGTLKANDINVGGLASAGEAGGNGTFTQSGTSAVTTTSNLNIGITPGTGTSTGSYTLSAGTISVTGVLAVGNNVGATGTFAQNGGSVTTTGLLQLGRNNSVGANSYTITSGTITATGGIWVGGGNGATAGAGTFTVSAPAVGSSPASITTAGDINVGSGGGAAISNSATGTLNLNAGSITDNKASGVIAVGNGLGATGTLSQDGGNLQLTTTGSVIDVGRNNATGTYNLISGDVKATLLRTAAPSGSLGTGLKAINFSGGTSTITSTTLNGSGTLTVSGGTHNLGTVTTGAGTLSLNNNSPTISAITFSSGGKIIGNGTVNIGGTITYGSSTIQVDSGTTTINGGITRSGSAATLTKAGTGTLTLAGAQTPWAGSGFTNSAGTLNFNADPNGWNVTANSATNFASTTPKVNNLTVGAGATATLAQNGNKTLTVAGTITFGGDGSGKLDLTNGKLIAKTAAVGSWGGQAYTGVTGLVAAARGDGSWTGSGIKTSVAGASDYTGLGVAKASDAIGVGTGTDLWHGQTVTGSDTLVMYTYGGDANLDGMINIDDYTQIDSSVSAGGALKGWLNGDFNYDGEVNIDDYTIIDSNIGIQGPPLGGAAGTAAALSGVTAVPEPASLGLIALGAGAMISRRRRRTGR